MAGNFTLAQFASNPFLSNVNQSQETAGTVAAVPKAQETAGVVANAAVDNPEVAEFKKTMVNNLSNPLPPKGCGSRLNLGGETAGTLACSGAPSTAGTVACAASSAGSTGGGGGAATVA